MITLYDTLNKQLKPLPERDLKMYVCGVTIYDYCHLGHARSYIAWDVLRRWIEHNGYKVYHVQNFTDVDDKIIKRAQEEKITVAELTNRFLEAYFEDMNWLNIEHANHYPRVTDYLKDMREAAERLVRLGFAYKSGDDIKFAGDNYKDYGKLSGRKTAEDFTVWKGSKADEPEFPDGRPGWHLECSVMIEKTLGQTIDIHAGGADLIFPHHENEIAQSECLHEGAPLANHWLHNGFVEQRGDKMGKSLNNAVNIRDYRLAGLDPNIIRFWAIQANYRKPIAQESLEDSAKQWASLREKLRKAPAKGVSEDFANAMNDDLNTAVALGSLFREPTLEMAGILGLSTREGSISEYVIDLLEMRKNLRLQKKYEQAGLVRQKIISMGYEVRDNPDGTSLALRK